MEIDHNLSRLIIEGESRVIIDLATKIIIGRDPDKITPSWHLLGPLNNLKSLLKPFLTLITSHIRRESNKVVDKLANEGVIPLRRPSLSIQGSHRARSCYYNAGS
jgi:hypothetical protein